MRFAELLAECEARHLPIHSGPSVYDVYLRHCRVVCTGKYKDLVAVTGAVLLNIVSCAEFIHRPELPVHVKFVYLIIPRKTLQASSEFDLLERLEFKQNGP
jgi:hypothetical protein